MGERNIRSQRQVKNFRGRWTETHRKAKREAEVLGAWPTSLVVQTEAQLPIGSFRMKEAQLPTGSFRMKTCWGPHTHLLAPAFHRETDRSLGDKYPAGEVRVGI